MAEEYCWAITHAAGQSCCCRSGARVLELAFQPAFLVYTYIVRRMNTEIRLAPDLLERFYCVRRGNVCDESNTLTILSSNNYFNSWYYIVVR
jgi:hypothetical protein